MTVNIRGDGDSLTLDVDGSSAQAVFTVSCVGASADNAASATNGTYWTFSTDRHEYYVWYNITGTASSGTVLSVADPTPTGLVGIPVSISVGAVASAHPIAHHTAVAINKLSELSVSSTALASANASVQFIVTMREFGDVPDARASSTAAGDISSSVFVALSITASGVARKDINVKFIETTAEGSLLNVIGGTGASAGSASTFDLTASTTVIHTAAKLNLFSGVAVSALSGSVLASAIKTDNRPLKGVN